MSIKNYILATIFSCFFLGSAFSQENDCSKIIYSGFTAEDLIKDVGTSRDKNNNILYQGKPINNQQVKNNDQMFLRVLGLVERYNPAQTELVWSDLKEFEDATLATKDRGKKYGSKEPNIRIQIVKKDKPSDPELIVVGTSAWSGAIWEEGSDLTEVAYNAILKSKPFLLISESFSNEDQENIIKAVKEAPVKINACVEAKAKIRRDIDLRTGSIDLNQYAGQTKDDLDAAIKSADAVVADPKTTMAELEKALADLNLAKDKADKEKTSNDIDALITSMKDDLKNYEGEEKEALEIAIKDAEDIAKNPNATMEELEKVLKDLGVVKDKAVEKRIKENRPNDIVKLKASLNALIAAMEADLGNYEGQAKSDLEDLIFAAKNIVNNPAISSEELVDAIVSVNGIWYQIPRKSSRGTDPKIQKDETKNKTQPAAKITIFGKEYNNLGTDRDAFIGSRSKTSSTNVNVKDMEKIDIFGKTYNNYKSDRDGFVGNRTVESKSSNTSDQKPPKGQVALSVEETDFLNIIGFTVSNAMTSFTDESVEDQIYDKLEVAANYVRTGKVVWTKDEIKKLIISFLLQDLSNTGSSMDIAAVTASFDDLNEDEMDEETFSLIVDKALEGKTEELKIMIVRSFYEVLVHNMEKKEGI